MEAKSIEQFLAKRFRLERAPTLLALEGGGNPIAFTRLRGQGGLHGQILSAPPEDAYAIQVALAPLSVGEVWVDGKHSARSPARPGDSFLFDISRDTMARLMPPFDFLRIFLPVATLQQLAYEQGAQRIAELKPALAGVNDPVLHGLAISIAETLEKFDDANTMFLDSIALALFAHISVVHNRSCGNGRSVHAGLAPWQLRRVYEYIEENLDGDPAIRDLAQECRLSESHFARAFRRTTGVPPHRWLMNRRIERAKELLGDGKLPLAEIALVCGFVDQSHFTRHFTRTEGYPPAKWRRLCCH